MTGLALLDQQMVVSVSIDGTIRRWSLREKDIELAKKKAKALIEEQPGSHKGSMLTAEEEQELADLMGEED